MAQKTPKRASNPKRKERRKASWQRGQRRKEGRRQAQAKREARNKELRAQGLPTPWEVAKARRLDRKHSVQQ